MKCHMDNNGMLWDEPKLKHVKHKPFSKISDVHVPAEYIDKMIDLHKEEFKLIRALELEKARLDGIIEVCNGLSFGSEQRNSQKVR